MSVNLKEVGDELVTDRAGKYCVWLSLCEEESRRTSNTMNKFVAMTAAAVLTNKV